MSVSARPRLAPKGQARTTYEEADRLMGLRAAGVARRICVPIPMLLGKQRADGGLGANSLSRFRCVCDWRDVAHAICIRVDDARCARPIKKASRFLLRTQFPDGSWYVRSRAPSFSPIFKADSPSITISGSRAPLRPGRPWLSLHRLG